MARSTMAYLIQEVKGRINAGTALYDEQHGGGYYWSDDRILEVLDRHRVDIWRQPLHPVVTYNNGTAVYLNYPSEQTYLEQTTSGGSAVFYLESGTNTVIGTANYSVDYQRGYITFGADQAGSVPYMTARSYDPDAAAAEIWRMKASWYATDYTFATDNHRVEKGAVMAQCMKMADLYDSRSKTGGVNVVTMYRSDYAHC